MNITKNYNNLKEAKTSLDKIIEELNVDSATKARLNNISSRMQMTIISLEKEETVEELLKTEIKIDGEKVRELVAPSINKTLND